MTATKQGLAAEILAKIQQGTSIYLLHRRVAEKLREYETAKPPIPPEVLALWAILVKGFCLQACKGEKDFFILLEQAPIQEKRQLQELLRGDGFDCSINVKLTLTIGNKTGYGTTLRW